METGIQLVKVLNPFNYSDREIEWIDGHGKTLAWVKDSFLPNERDYFGEDCMPDGVTVHFIISLNGQIVLPEHLHLTFVKDGDCIVVIPHMHYGGVVAGLAALAMEVAAATTSALIAEMALATSIWLMQNAAMVGFILQCAVSLVGGLLLTSMAGSPSVDESTATSSPTYSWNPSTTQTPGSPVPAIYGTLKVHGNIISTYAEYVSDKAYLDVLISLGFGPIDSISDQKINNQPFDNLSGVTIQFRRGNLAQPLIAEFVATKTEYDVNMAVTYVTPLVYKTIGNEYDRLEIDITFASGLFIIGKTDYYPSTVQYRIDYRPTGAADDAWTPLVAFPNYTDTSLPLSRWSCGYWDINVIGPGEQYGEKFWVEMIAGPDVRETPGYYEGMKGPEMGGFMARWGYWHWMTLDTVVSVASFDNYRTVTRNSTAAFTITETSIPLPHGNYEIKITRLTADTTDVKIKDKTYLSAVREVYNETISYPREVLIGVKALAQDQLSGTFNYSCICKGKLIRVYNGSAWIIQYSASPAWVTYDVLTQPVFYDPDIVYYSGYFYRCILSHTSGAITPATDTTHTYWMMESALTATDWIDTGSYYAGACTIAYDSGLPSLFQCVKSHPIWAQTTQYAVGDLCHISGTIWQCILAHTALYATNRPGTGSDYATYWVDSGYTMTNTCPFTGASAAIFWVQRAEKVWVTGTDCKDISDMNASGVARYDGYDPSSIEHLSFKTWADFCATLIYDGKGNIVLGADGFSYACILAHTATADDKPGETVPTANWATYWIKSGTGGLAWVSGASYTVSTIARFEYNGIFDTENTAWGAALQVAKESRGALHWYGSQIVATIEKADTAVQLFSMGNIIKDSFEEIFLSVEDRASEVNVTFLNKDKDYAQDIISYTNPSLPNTSNKVSIQVPGTTSYDQASRIAQFYLLCNETLKRTIKFKAASDAVTCTRGDLINVQHDVPKWGLAGGRIVSATSTPTATITIDRELTLAAGTYSILIRLNSKTDTQQDKFVLRSIIIATPVTTATFTVSAPWDVGYVPELYDVYAFGLYNVEVKPFRVLEVSHNTQEMTASITALEYNANLYATDDGIAPLPAVVYVTPDKLLPVTNLATTEAPYFDASGNYIHKTIVTFTKPTCYHYRTAMIFIRKYVTLNGVVTYSPWGQAGETINASFEIESTSHNTSYEVMVASVSTTGVKLDDALCPTITFTTEGVILDAVAGIMISGLQIFGQGHDTTFAGKDCRIAWHSANGIDVGAGEESMGAGAEIPPVWFRGYQVKILDTDGTERRTEIVETNEYIYTYEKNHADAVRLAGSVAETFILQVNVMDRWNRFSLVAGRLLVTNAVPGNVAGLGAQAAVGGVLFTWTNNTDPDLRGYQYRVMIANTTWGAWTTTEGNSIHIALTAAQIATYGNKANIAIEVKALDWFGQVSAAAATVSANANVVADNIFQLIASTDGTGTPSSLYDGDTASGGILI